MSQAQRSMFEEFRSFEQIEPPENVSKGYNDWSVPWADLMMIMFVLFVVLFVYASANKDLARFFSEESGAVPEAQAGVRERVSQASRELLYKARDGAVSVIRENEDRVRVILRGDVFFEAGRERLSARAAAYLAEVGELMRLSAGSVHVIGYADEHERSGAASYALSAQRAANVAEYFIEAMRVDPRRFVISGRGAYQPETPEFSENSARLNRRVEIVIMTDNA